MAGREYGQYGQYHNYINANRLHSKAPDVKRLQAPDLKICDLCGALNLAHNTECFVCRWKGHFEQRADVVKIAMELTERQHGHLDLSLLTSDSVYCEPQKRNNPNRLHQLLLRIHHWFFG